MITAALLDPEIAGFLKIVSLPGHGAAVDLLENPALPDLLMQSGLFDRGHAKALENWLPDWIDAGAWFVDRDAPHANSSSSGPMVFPADLRLPTYWRRFGSLVFPRWEPVKLAVGPGARSVAWYMRGVDSPECVVIIWDDEMDEKIGWLEGLTGLVPKWPLGHQEAVASTPPLIPVLGSVQPSGHQDLVAVWSVEARDWHEGASVWWCGTLPDSTGDIIAKVPVWLSQPYSGRVLDLPALWRRLRPTDPCIAVVPELIAVNMVSECRELEERGLGLASLQSMMDHVHPGVGGYRVSGDPAQFVTLCAREGRGEWIGLVARGRWVRENAEIVGPLIRFLCSPLRWIAFM